MLYVRLIWRKKYIGPIHIYLFICVCLFYTSVRENIILLLWRSRSVSDKRTSKISNVKITAVATTTNVGTDDVLPNQPPCAVWPCRTATTTRSPRRGRIIIRYTYTHVCSDDGGEGVGGDWRTGARAVARTAQGQGRTSHAPWRRLYGYDDGYDDDDDAAATTIAVQPIPPPNCARPGPRPAENPGAWPDRIRARGRPSPAKRAPEKTTPAAAAGGSGQRPRVSCYCLWCYYNNIVIMRARDERRSAPVWSNKGVTPVIHRQIDSKIYFSSWNVIIWYA